MSLPSFAFLGQSKSLTFEDGLKDSGADKDDDEEGGGKSNSGVPEPCCPEICSKIFRWATCLDDTALMRAWSGSRKVIHDVVDNPFFEWTILLLIFASRYAQSSTLMLQ